jgi:hypothetical protein
MKVALIMKAVHWSRGNECDLGADIGPRIASSLSYTDRVGESQCEYWRQHSTTGFPYQAGKHMFQGRQIKCLNYYNIYVTVL